MSCLFFAMRIITIDPHGISTMEALYDFFELELGQVFAHNLDALADILSERPATIRIIDEARFWSVFGPRLTREYYGDRYDSHVPTVAQSLTEIFIESGDFAFLPN
jgi:Barstar (barnase inhibitor)